MPLFLVHVKYLNIQVSIQKILTIHSSFTSFKIDTSGNIRFGGVLILRFKILDDSRILVGCSVSFSGLLCLCSGRLLILKNTPVQLKTGYNPVFWVTFCGFYSPNRLLLIRIFSYYVLLTSTQICQITIVAHHIQIYILNSAGSNHF